MKFVSVLLRRQVALAGFVVASAAFAQVNLNTQLPLPSTTPPPRAGLIGTNYFALDAARVDQKAANGNTTGAALAANLAANEIADVTFTLAWAKQRDWPDNGNIYQFGIDLTPHLRFGHVTPFLVGGVGYQFTRTPVGQDLALWNLGGGVEFLVAARTALVVKAVNVGSFSKGISNPWQYTAGVNHWLNERLALNASCTFIEDQATGYSLGVRWGF
jgi:hypothetical protein